MAGSYRQNNKGITLIESLVAVVIVAIGFLSVYQLTSYAVNSVSASLDRTKLNFLSEMMMEDIMADPKNAQLYQYKTTCSYTSFGNTTQVSDQKRNDWNNRFRDVLNVKACRANDTKETVITDTGQYVARINIKNKDGRQRKYLGLVIKK